MRSDCCESNWPRVYDSVEPSAARMIFIEKAVQMRVFVNKKSSRGKAIVTCNAYS